MMVLLWLLLVVMTLLVLLWLSLLGEEVAVIGSDVDFVVVLVVGCDDIVDGSVVRVVDTVDVVAALGVVVSSMVCIGVSDLLVDIGFVAVDSVGDAFGSVVIDDVSTVLIIVCSDAVVVDASVVVVFGSVVAVFGFVVVVVVGGIVVVDGIVLVSAVVAVDSVVIADAVLTAVGSVVIVVGPVVVVVVGTTVFVV
ncbi:Hypothetical predicted protein [Octopus vulgaris]|uniref:Uncharacterized protein n=1 Tax=Octopus vulgaris TaxID=6645 RepID=A0AA36BJM4_OCTVU|nr:Hypothetical predicted protein [Octopus vulgaris]